MTRIAADTVALDAAATYLLQLHESLQKEVLQTWQDIDTNATGLPTFTNAQEPRQALADTIPSLTRLLAIRKFIADTIQQDSQHFKGLETAIADAIKNLESN